MPARRVLDRGPAGEASALGVFPCPFGALLFVTTGRHRERLGTGSEPEDFVAVDHEVIAHVGVLGVEHPTPPLHLVCSPIGGRPAAVMGRWPRPRGPIDPVALVGAVVGPTCSGLRDRNTSSRLEGWAGVRRRNRSLAAAAGGWETARIVEWIGGSE